MASEPLANEDEGLGTNETRSGARGARRRNCMAASPEWWQGSATIPGRDPKEHFKKKNDARCTLQVRRARDKRQKHGLAKLGLRNVARNLLQ